MIALDHVASRIVNADHSTMCATAMLRVINGIASRVRPVIPQAAEWQRIGNQIDAAFIFAWAHFVNVHHLLYLPV